jgi:DNA-binding transcriptional LysR family regulator
MKSGQVVDVMPHLPQEKQGIYLIYPPGRFTQPKVRAFIDFLVGAFSGKGPDVW